VRTRERQKEKEVQILTVQSKDLECGMREAKQAAQHETTLRGVLEEANKDLRVCPPL